MQPPNPNEKALQLIKSFENFRSKAYLDLAGIPTIGWGTTKGVKLGMTTTVEQAEEWLKRDVAEIENSIALLIKIPLEEAQFAALVSLAYNIGISQFKTSTLLKKLNEGDKQGVIQLFMRWRYVHHREVAGLAQRRKHECELFLS